MHNEKIVLVEKSEKNSFPKLDSDSLLDVKISELYLLSICEKWRRRIHETEDAVNAVALVSLK